MIGESAMTLQSRMDGVIEQALASRIVGCVVLLRRGGEQIYARAAGLADREAGRAMAQDAIFRLASVTKPIVATCVLRMVEAGLIGLDEAVTVYLPGFRPKAPDGSQPKITIRQLLTHTSGLTYGGAGEYARGLAGPLISLEENMRRLAGEPLLFAPGTAWEYGMSIDVLGAVVAAVNGTDVAGAVARYVTGPLAMVDTGFGVRDAGRLAAAYVDGRPPKRMAEPEIVTDDDGETAFSPGRIFEASAPQSGGAGMAGTAGDVMALLEGVRAGFLQAATQEMAFANQVGDLMGRAGKGFGFLGAVLHDPVAAETAMPVGAVDWGGAYGHNWVVDRGTGTVLVVCTNTAFEGCNGAFREEMVRAVYG